jgi:hypothetical protein
MRLTNAQMAMTDTRFRKACEEIGVFPSRRRYRQYKHGNGVVAEVARARIDNSQEKGIQVQAK